MRRKLFLSGFLFLLISCFPVVVNGESSAVWSQTYGGTGEDVAQAVVETSDGGYAIAGYTQSFGAGIYDFWLVKTDASGNLEWNRTYGGPEVDKAYSLIRTSDGGYAIVGETYSFGAGSSDFWLMKTDASGDMEWNQTYGGERGDHAYAVVETSNGGYAIAGETLPAGTQSSSYWLVKTDASGAMEWNQTYGITLDAEAKSLVEKPDGGYAIAGTNDYLTHQVANFWFTDELGNGDYLQTSFGGNGALYSLVNASDGGYAMAGDTDSFDADGRDFWLVKTDESGNIEWNKTYGGTDYDYGRSLVATSDGGYTLAGYTYIPHSETYNCWLVKTNSSGNMEWNRTYGGFAHSLVTTSDGGYAIAGTVAGDFWLIKTDEYGVVPEFQIWLVPLLLAVATVVSIIYRKKL